jgi:pimeloyl-ACP methyl ester carboxylesterase
MPLNMAIFNENAADEAMEKLPDIKEWYVGGHSMGGAISSAYAAGHPEKVEGLILMGAYLYGDYPGDRTLVIYGSLNVSVEKHLKGTEHVFRIEGGNHAQFGNYGVQRGDAAAVISREEQQESAAEAVKGFIKTEP